ncbi:protein transport protein SEC16A homolog [Typha angustifolia]|uniref:protein transport protein SEC16A homolog n=1 Tax=Typha angustifolia TaxID=59011 RepID=UPI003C2E9D4C
MASPLPFQIEDQTDEDFFDKLVNDELGIEGSSSVSKEIVEDLSNLSLGDVSTSLEDSGDAEFASELEPKQETSSLITSETMPNDALAAEDSLLSAAASDTTTIQSVGSTENAMDVGSPGSSMAKGSGSKGTSVKEVQWTAFSDNSQQSNHGGFGSYSDFLTADKSAEFVMNDTDPNLGYEENNNQITDMGSSDQQDTQFYGFATEQVPDANDAHYWENLYPGWKYDASTGQWYQLDSPDATENAQWDNSRNVANLNFQKNYEEKVHPAVDESFAMKSDVSYLQQTAQSVLKTITEESTISSVSNWNQGSTEYPPNMVFDSQYPGWYYDTNSQQWYTLESYMQSIQMASSTVEDQASQVMTASAGVSQQNSIYNEGSQDQTYTIQGHGGQEFAERWNASTGNYGQQNIWQPEPVDNNRNIGSSLENQQTGNLYSSMGHSGSHTEQQIGYKAFEPVTSQNYGIANGVVRSQGFVPAESVYQYNQPNVGKSPQIHSSSNYYENQNSMNSQNLFQSSNPSFSQFSYASHEGRSSDGRPAHALVTFGFGGKVIVMKDATSTASQFEFGNQGMSGGTISILSLSDIMMDKADGSSVVSGCAVSYFHALCQQPFPGPLVGGNAATKDVNKWVDERIMNCESPSTDFRKGELLKLLLSLLKISCQHYGKLRSPFGSDLLQEETDGPEMAVTKLFASAKKSSARLREYDSFTHCMQNLPSEGQIRATAAEVQNLLVSGRRKEALQYAQEGQLWGPALILAAQLGDKFYVETVKKMAHHQFISGSPLRTLCLLIAGQPADVFSDSSTNSLYGAANASHQPTEVKANGMLDDWEENLAIITANRTKDDELVMIHLGDCLWRERGEVTAAHTCYLVAEANFESYSDSARLCLIGADHWKYPRTYASPEAIQRTELYEYSKVLGNSQYILLPLQPYKLIYAHMLAEVGKVPDSLRYCQASLKLLKSSGRAPEVETWKSLFSSLEERLRAHQQGGYGTNLAPSKFVGKLFTSIDRSIHRMIGAPPAPLPPLPQGSLNSNDNNFVAPKVVNSQSTMAMSTLIPSASVESISEWTGDSSKKIMHNRSISEPDFGRSPKQDAGSDGAQTKAASGGSRFGRLGSQFLQKTMGWVSRSHRQAKLGEQNKFYYDEKLKRWVEEGAEIPAEEPALPPPPTTSFQNGTLEHNINSAFVNESLTSNGVPEAKPPNHSEHSSGIPPIPPSQNQFSARGRMGVRSRYVDTFNKGGGSSPSLFQSPAAAPSVKLAAGAKFFVPTAPSGGEELKSDQSGESHHEITAENPSISLQKETPSTSPSMSPSSSIECFPNMGNTIPYGSKTPGPALPSGNAPLSRTRAASWSGTKPVGDGQAVLSPFMPNYPSRTRSSSSSSLQVLGGSTGDDLHEVEL